MCEVGVSPACQHTGDSNGSGTSVCVSGNNTSTSADTATPDTSPAAPASGCHRLVTGRIMMLDPSAYKCHWRGVWAINILSVISHLERSGGLSTFRIYCWDWRGLFVNKWGRCTVICCLQAHSVAASAMPSTHMPRRTLSFDSGTHTVTSSDRSHSQSTTPTAIPAAST